MIPAHTYVEDAMKHHYAAKQNGSKIMTIQNRAFVEPEDMPDSIIKNKQLGRVKKSRSRRFGTVNDWREQRYDQTDRLKSIPDSINDPSYLIGSTFSGGNCSFSKADAVEAGLFDEEFNAYGAEDTEFGIRLYEHFNNKLNEPLFFVPVDTTAYHLEHGGSMNSRMPEEARELFWNKVNEVRARAVDPRPEVSVYIPCYNQKKYIEKALASINKQKGFDLSQLEVVIGEDGSKDGTREVLKRIQRDYQGSLKIRIVDDGKNHGMAENTNRTIQACRGEYIIQLDADDEFLPNAIHSLTTVLKANPHASLAFGDCIDRNVLTGETKPHWSCNEFTEEWYEEKDRHRDEIVDLLRKGMRLHHPRMFRREHFFKTEGVTPTLENAVDYDLYLKLAEVGAPIHVQEPLYVYNTNHGTNTSFKQSNLQKANGEIVKKTSRSRDSARRRKEVYLIEEGKNPERTKHFNLAYPDLRLSELYEVWQKDEQRQKGTPLYESTIRELERVVSFFRWIHPKVARKQLALLQQLEPNNPAGIYYQATFLHSDGDSGEALETIKKVRNPSARTLEEMIRQSITVTEVA